MQMEVKPDESWCHASVFTLYPDFHLSEIDDTIVREMKKC